MFIELLATQPRAALEAAIEQRAKTIYCGRGMTLARVLGELFLYIDMRELTIAPTLAMHGYWEFWVTQAIARHVKPGMVCVDVGANVGYYTMLMAQLVGSAGQVTAYDLLFKNAVTWIPRSAEINGFRGRVRSKCAGVGALTGFTAIQVPRSHDEWGHFGNAALLNQNSRLPQGESWDTKDLSCTTLDAEFPEGQVDFVKVDVEGAEPLVWEGSKQLRARTNPVFTMEYEGWRPGYPEWIASVRAEGYRVRFIDYTSELVELPASVDPERLYMLWITR